MDKQSECGSQGPWSSHAAELMSFGKTFATLHPGIKRVPEERKSLNAVSAEIGSLAEPGNIWSALSTLHGGYVRYINI